MALEAGTLAPSGFATIEHGGLTVSSTSRTEAELRSDMEAPSEKDEASEAAAKLGKRGGAAAAEARKAKKPEADAEDEGDEPAPDKKAAAKSEKKAKAEPEADDEEEGDDKPTLTKEQIEKRRQKTRERVEKATRETADLKRENQKLANELAALRAPKPDAAPKSQTKAEEQEDPADPKPKLEDYEDYAEGVEARARWAARQESKKLQAEHQRTQRRQEFATTMDRAASVVEKAIKESGGQEFLDDMSDDVLALEPSFAALERGEKPGPSHALADEVLRAGEQAPRLMRYLSENPEVLQRLTSPTLRPSEFAREMGRIDERLSAATSGNPAPKPTSKAPRPARPVAGAPVVPADEMDDSRPLSAFVRDFARREANVGR